MTGVLNHDLPEPPGQRDRRQIETCSHILPIIPLPLSLIENMTAALGSFLLYAIIIRGELRFNKRCQNVGIPKRILAF